MKVTKAQAEANRALVVQTASQLFRERGFDGVGVADLMAAAGFTHGGFYKQFGSKADLMAESTACGIAQTAALSEGVDALTFVSHYLSREHRDGRATGCTMAALGGDAARQPDAVRAAFAEGVERLLTALGPLSTDFYLPSLPDIVRVMQTDVAGAQATLSAFLFGFAGGQILWGPLSDRLGRRPVLLTGLALFTLATLACALAPSIEALTAARAVQALGASGPIVLGRAMVRDLYEGPRAGRELARMGMIMGLVPAVAPVLGGVLQQAFGWRSTFVASLAFAAVLAAVVGFLLPETLRTRSREPLSLLAIIRGFGTLLQNRAYRVYVGLTALAYGGLFAFISGSSFVLIGIHGLTPAQYGLSFGFGVLGFILGTILAQRLVGRRGMDGVIGLGVVCLAAGGLAMLGRLLRFHEEARA